MKKNLLLMISFAVAFGAFSQPRQMQRPSTYSQVDAVRKELNLDSKQFEKVYKAYEKFNEALFGTESADGRFQGPPPGGGGQGRPAGGPPPGGMSGGMPGGHGQMGSPDRHPKELNMEELEKKRDKQEKKLVKSMKKIFKKDDALFVRWQEIRQAQLQEMFPAPPPQNELPPSNPE